MTTLEYLRKPSQNGFNELYKVLVFKNSLNFPEGK